MLKVCHLQIHALLKMTLITLAMMFIQVVGQVTLFTAATPIAGQSTMLITFPWALHMDVVARVLPLAALHRPALCQGNFGVPQRKQQLHQQVTLHSYNWNKIIRGKINYTTWWFQGGRRGMYMEVRTEIQILLVNLLKHSLTIIRPSWPNRHDVKPRQNNSI